MLNFASIMIGSEDVEKLADFYRKVFERKEDMQDGGYHGWLVGKCFFTVGEHSEVKGKSKEPARFLFNFETTEVKKEFDRIVKLGAKAVKEPYEMSGMWVS